MCRRSRTAAELATIFETTGAVVRGATLTITNLGTNQQISRKTSGEGTYALDGLEPVFYRLVVGQSGFKKRIIDQVKVDTASITKVDVTLEPGAVGTEVQVIRANFAPWKTPSESSYQQNTRGFSRTTTGRTTTRDPGVSDNAHTGCGHEARVEVLMFLGD